MPASTTQTAVRAAVAAGHPATADAGAEILGEGGSAADAAVAACLASCVAETVMTGLLGGGHAIHYDAAARSAAGVDCFVAVPGLGAEAREAELLHLEVPFGAELVHYAVGPASCGVPGVPAGLDALWRAHGRLPWPRLCEPALRLARAGVPMPAAHVACLEMLEPVMTMNEGGRIYSPGGRLLREGDLLEQPGLVRTLELLAAEGARSVYTGSIAEALLSLSDARGGLLTRADLASYEARWVEPVEVRYCGARFLTRGGLSGVSETLVRLPLLRGLTETARVAALLAALADAGRGSQSQPPVGSTQTDARAEPARPEDGADTRRLGPGEHTTNLTVVDAEGNACVVTTSLGLGSGDFLPRLDLHLNSMLGEADLLRGRLEPGERMGSMMAPSLALDRDGLVLAAGSAGGTRLRTALVGAVSAILDEGLSPEAAVERPRFHPVGSLVNAEPGVDEEALAALEAAGWTVRRWPAQHHYFGGVSVVARGGAAADPRRNGAVRRPG